MATSALRNAGSVMAAFCSMPGIAMAATDHPHPDIDPGGSDDRDAGAQVETVEVEPAPECDADPCPSRIVSPTQFLVSAAQAPWQVSIQSYQHTGYTQAELRQRPEWERRHKCGGTLIARQWVLTAAHCLNPTRMKPDFDLRVRIGSDNLARMNGCLYRVDRKIKHPDYDDDTLENDVALLRIQVPRRGRCRNLPEPVRLYAEAEPLPHRAPVSAYGWGKTKEGDSGRQSAALLGARIANVGLDTCKVRWGDRITDTNICAYKRDTDTCKGDSGGPLLIGEAGEADLQAGIVSWGRGCARRGWPGIYSNVGYYIDWIERTAGIRVRR